MVLSSSSSNLLAFTAQKVRFSAYNNFFGSQVIRRSSKMSLSPLFGKRTFKEKMLAAEVQVISHSRYGSALAHYINPNDTKYQ